MAATRQDHPAGSLRSLFYSAVPRTQRPIQPNARSRRSRSSGPTGGPAGDHASGVPCASSRAPPTPGGDPDGTPAREHAVGLPVGSLLSADEVSRHGSQQFRVLLDYPTAARTNLRHVLATLASARLPCSPASASGWR